MRGKLTVALLMFGLVQGAALAGDAADTRNQEWIRRLQNDPVASRRRLIHQIRDEANARASETDEEPVHTTNRPDLLPVLEVGLADEDEQVRSDAIGAIKYMRHPKAYDILVRALDSKSSTVRFFAVNALGWLGDVAPARSSTRAAAAPSADDTRDKTAPTDEEKDLAELRGKVIAVLERVREKPDAEDKGVPLFAAEELVRIGAPTDTAIFYEALRTGSVNAGLAVTALAKLGRKDAIQLMIQSLRAAPRSLDHWITEDLKKLTGETSIGIDADAWQKWLDAHRSALPEQSK